VFVIVVAVHLWLSFGFEIAAFIVRTAALAILGLLLGIVSLGHQAASTHEAL
jgi:hypothetical protein